jgi:hypothetical protein
MSGVSVYADVDPAIARWVDKNSLSLFTGFAGREERFVYKSSEAGECYQIYIQPPERGRIRVSFGYIEGAKEDGPDQHRTVPVEDLEGALDEALDAVINLMATSN